MIQEIENKRLEKLALKISETKKAEEEIKKQQEQQKRLVENYILGKDEESSYEEPENDLDNESLYDQNDDSISDDSRESYNKNKRKRNKTRDNWNRDKEIKVKNKFYDNMYEDYNDYDKEYVDKPSDEINFDDEWAEKKPKTDFKFNQKLNSLNKSDEPTIVADVWRKISKNKLAEMGIDIKLNIKDSYCETQNVNNTIITEDISINPIVLPEMEIKDHEIEFIDPERIKIEQIENERKDEDPFEKDVAPVLMGKSFKNTKRAQYFQQLQSKTRKTCTIEEVNMRNQVTSLVSKKQEQKKDEPEDQEEIKRQLIEQADEYINQDINKEDEEAIDYK